MNIHPLLNSPRFIKLAIWIVISMIVLVSVSIVTGNFVPLQTSIVTELGLCIQDEALAMVDNIPSETETIFICGKVEGPTKRRFSILLLYKGERVFFRSRNWPAGTFFVPVNASELSNFETSVFLPGLYRIGITYSRPIALESTFEVGSD